MPLLKMNSLEKRSVFSLSLIMALRMLGLFMVLPIFTLYATHLKGATPILIGITLGIYGLTQAILQIPLGALSDYIGRKKIITFGLLVFIVGSIIAALSHTIWVMLVGRALQGAGAIGSTIIALISDLTRAEQRTKAMAISGITIGMSFMLAMMLGPVFANWMDVNGIFWLAAVMSFFALILLYFSVPTEPTIPRASNPYKGSPIVGSSLSSPSVSGSSIPGSLTSEFSSLIKNPHLFRLNIGIFILHAIFTASFVVIPISLHTVAHLSSNDQWMLYLPTIMIAFVIALPCIVLAEKQQRVRVFFVGGILILALAEILFWIFANKLLLSALSLLLFFSAFSLLEAFLPSLISRTAPPHRKGMALGIYSFSQFFGIFVGGSLGGWLYGVFGLTEVNLFCAFLAFIWVTLAFNMKNPQYAIQQ